jgi:hypothetical protein
MSLIEQAKAELAIANFGEEDSRTMVEILRKFFDQWDSGGAVYVAAPVLQRLIAGKPLVPLTGLEGEWYQPVPSDPILQNKRCSSVFKGPDGLAYDIDVKGRPVISFPYWPDRADVSSPVIEINEKEFAA